MLRKSTFRVTEKPVSAHGTAHMAAGRPEDGSPDTPKMPRRPALRAQNEGVSRTAFVKIYYRHKAHPLPRIFSPRAPIL